MAAAQPMAARVYDALRDQVVDGGLAPGAPLVQEQIAERLGVSRTPVREALGRLVHDGLAEWVAGGGYVVRDLADQQITEVHQVRETLETLALRLAAGRYTRLQLARLATCVEEMAETAPGEVAAHFELNRRFHRGLVEPCGNALLVTMIDQLWDHPVNRRITRSYVLADPANVETMIAEHRDLLAAARAGEEDELVTRYTAHVRRGYGDLLGGAQDGEVPPRRGDG